MTLAALVLALSGAAGAQAPPSTTTAVAVSTAAAAPAADGAAAAGYVVPAQEEKPKPARPLRVKIQKEAKDWEPVSVRAGGEPLGLSTAFERRITGKRGLRSRAKAVVRVHPKNEDSVLIVAVFPEALKKDRTHVEARLKIVEGFLEEARVAAVTAQHDAGPELDSRKLKLAGVPFEEQFPEEAVLTLAAVDPAAGKSALNAGRLKARFGSEELGLVSMSWSVRGVNLKDAASQAKGRDGELPGCPDDTRKPDVPLLRARAQESADAQDFDGAYRDACYAARAGDPASQYLVATIFRYGYGRARPRDLKLAALWYSRAAAQNHAAAHGALHQLYAKSDPARAREHLRRAARLGHAESQAGLGAAYRAGRGEKQDNVEAYRWYWLAHKKGFRGAERPLDEIAADLSPMQIDEAKRRADAQLPAPSY